ncbi:MAG: inorganic phosphate transporter, partial [Deltaproteobacteria bacterium]|nr:inorganic phosphate transporter [Deltaproteobacteria bacterium]
TVVSTRVLSPRMAVIWAAFFNFAAAFIFGLHVAKTVGKGIVDPEIVSNEMLLSALLGAIIWVHICTRAGLPISVSHSLIGGLVGSALAKTGISSIIASGLIKVTLFIFLSPLIGMIFGMIFQIAVYRLFYRMTLKQAERVFGRLQLISAGFYSLSHGANDAQKTMGIIAILLFSNGYLGQEFNVPWWVIISCHSVIALGTLAGGWKVVQTMGLKITKLRPVSGFCAESGAAAMIIGASFAGIPVSTTHTITGSILGVGTVTNIAAVHWGVTKNIMGAWILTIPTTAIVSALFYYAITLIF